jgi:hypothetical protein
MHMLLREELKKIRNEATANRLEARERPKRRKIEDEHKR